MSDEHEQTRPLATERFDDEPTAVHDEPDVEPEPQQEARPEPRPWTHPEDEPARSGRHPLLVSYLVAGLVFLGIAASWALRTSGVIEPDDGAWLVPLTLVVAGAVGLAAWLASSARKPR